MKLIDQIRHAVKNGEVKEPFKASDFKFLTKSPSYLSKHVSNNGLYIDYFIRISRGRYKLINS